MARLFSVDQAGKEGVKVNDVRYLCSFRVFLSGDILKVYPHGGDFYEGNLQDVFINGVLYPGNPEGALEALAFVGNFGKGDFVPREVSVTDQYGRECNGVVENGEATTSITRTVNEMLKEEILLDDFKAFLKHSYRGGPAFDDHAEGGVYVSGGYDEGSPLDPYAFLRVEGSDSQSGDAVAELGVDLSGQRAYFRGTNAPSETVLHSGNYRDYAVPVFLEDGKGFNYWGAEISEREAKLAHRTMHDDGSRFESAIGFYEYGQLTCIGTSHTDQAGSIADYLFIRSHPNLRGLFYHKEETDGTIRDVRLDPQDFSAVWQDTGVRWINGKSIYWMTYTATPDSPISNAGQYAKGWVNTGCVVINSWVIDTAFGPCNAKVYGIDDGTYTHLYVYGTPINADVREYAFVVWFVDR